MNPPAKGRARHEVAPLADLPPGARKIVTIPGVGKGMQIGVFNVGGRLVAYRSLCPHAGAPVCEGRVGGTMASVGGNVPGREGEILRCPWHGWEFDLLNGEHLVDGKTRPRADAVEAAPPAVASASLESFEVEIRDGVVRVLV